MYSSISSTTDLTVYTSTSGFLRIRPAAPPPKAASTTLASAANFTPLPTPPLEVLEERLLGDPTLPELTCNFGTQNGVHLAFELDGNRVRRLREKDAGHRPPAEHQNRLLASKQDRRAVPKFAHAGDLHRGHLWE